MARGPFGQAGSSTVIQPVGSQTKPTVITRALVGLRKVFFTSADLQQPERLYQVLYQLQQNMLLALTPLASNPSMGSVFLRGVVFTTGQTQYLSHGLGRPWVGYRITRAQGNTASFTDVAQPAGVGANLVIPLLSANAGTYDIEVF